MTLMSCLQTSLQENLDSKTGGLCDGLPVQPACHKGEKQLYWSLTTSIVAQSAERIEFLKDGVVVSTKKGKHHAKSCLRGVKDGKNKKR